ncbi:MAG: protein-L-isoaspartate(D-aspartate) O-methyltransferase [Deltaproteobacteria bacterium]|nr:protein-L-isoaspartate(D-aspartate) O-methyltransferase [Deltaproteobacteria bacterium]
MKKADIDEMLRTIEDETRYTRGMTGVPSLRPEVLAAMRQVPREEFVSNFYKTMAYDNTPLPIGNGQTISQPFIVALMTDLLRPDKDKVILEVGTGSGYQAAVLSLLVRQVYTLEIIPALAGVASARLKRLGYTNIEVSRGDGNSGWPEHAPFDGIIVTASAPHVPPVLKEQLKPGGRLVIPVGLTAMPQELLMLEKNDKGEIRTRHVLSVSFVPLTGNGGNDDTRKNNL